MTEFASSIPVETEQPKPESRNSVSRIKQCVGVAAAVGVALLSPEIASAQVEVSGPHMEIGITDDGAAKNNYNNTREMALSAGREMGATVWRSIVYPHEFQDPELVKMYDALVEAAFARGYKIHLTLACNDQRWTPDQFANYAVQVMRRYGDKVARYSICNEPNYKLSSSGGLYPLPGKTDAETYRLIYDKTYKTMKLEAKGQNREVEVLALELGAGVRAWEFLEKFLACPDFRQVHCAVITDGDALHLYQFKTSPTQPDKGGIEIGSLDKIEDFFDEAYASGLIKTQDGERPKTFVTEIGYMNENASGKWEDERLKEWKREIFYRRAESVGCEDSDVAAWMIHGLVETPEFSDSPWDTGIVSANGLKSRSYYAIREYTAKHTECVIP